MSERKLFNVNSSSVFGKSEFSQNILCMTKY